MKREDWLRERSCTRKRPFKTREYAEMFLNHLGHKGSGQEVYHCEKFCGEFHLGHSKNDQRQRQAN